MELVFAEKPCRYLRRVVHAARAQEQTADVIVPDSFPDVERIVYAGASAIVRSKECRAGSVSVTGGLRAAALYVPDDGSQPRVLDAYIPFTVRLDDPALTEQTQVIVQCGVCSADARMVNSRKVLLRVSVCCTADGFEPAEQTLYTLSSRPPQLQLREQTYPVLLPVETAEKSFTVSDEIMLPTGAALGQLCCFDTAPQVDERRVVGNKAVFKGTLCVHALYKTPEGRMQTVSQIVPFSQYCELSGEYDDGEAQITMAVTGAQLEPDAAQPEQKLCFAVQLLAQCTVSRMQSVTLLEDAYAIGAELTPQWCEVALESRLDAQTLRQTLRDTVHADVQSVAECAAYLGLPVQTRVQGGVHLEVPAFVNLLYYDRDDALQGASARLAAQCDVALAQEGQCIVQPALLPDTYAAPTPDGAEVRCDCQLGVQCFSGQTLRTLCGGELEAQPRPVSRPSVIVRRAEQGSALWELAKTYGASVDAIRSANDLTGDEIAAGEIVLIPM